MNIFISMFEEYKKSDSNNHPNESLLKCRSFSVTAIQQMVGKVGKVLSLIFSIVQYILKIY